MADAPAYGGDGTPFSHVSMYRNKEGLGIWEHKGKVAAVGIGHSPTSRRWDGTPENTVGAWAILALRKAIADAGVSPDQVDGLVLDPQTTTGAHWPAERPVPMDVVNAFNPSNDPLDGIAKLSASWILKNMPELTNVKFTMYAMGCMTNALVVAAQAVGEGRTHTCLVLKGWHNLDGRYYQGGGNAQDTVSGGAKWTNLWAGPACFTTATQFQAYCDKYGKNHDMMAPYVVESKKNGLNFPEGFFYQNRPEALTVEDYLSARWVAKPANLYDNDIPIMCSSAFLLATPERAKDMKQKPVYILNHCSTDALYYGPQVEGYSPKRAGRGIISTLEDVEAITDSTGRKIYEGSGITAKDLSFENMYDGFSLFHQFHIEGLGYAGIKRGEALDLYQTDISNDGPHPVSPSGGNIGSGRTRVWQHTDSIQQIQGRAGARQIKKKAEIGVSGGPMPDSGNFLVWSATPS